jgi:hypothetical protein
MSFERPAKNLVSHEGERPMNTKSLDVLRFRVSYISLEPL